jgi:hypothetical protein
MRKKWMSLSVVTLFAITLTIVGCGRKEEPAPPPPPPAAEPAPAPEAPAAEPMKEAAPEPEKKEEEKTN